MQTLKLTAEQKKAIQREILRREAPSCYASYVEYVHDGRWIRGKAVNYLCGKVQAFLERDSDAPYQILIISLPPQHGKSLTVTETLPSWYLGKRPDGRVIEISYSEDFAQLFGRRNKTKIEEYGKTVFGMELAKSPNSNTEFELSNNIGGMISRGVMSGVTGRACNLMIIDDPIKNRQEADSELYRQRVWDEWENSFKTRLSAGAHVIVIQTRWHEDDLAGRILAREKHVELINLPCEAEKNDPIGRTEGEALCPEIGKNTKWLIEYKSSYLTQSGTRAWNALFQGRPTSAEGNLIRRNWWGYYTDLPVMIQQIISVDATFKDGDDNDFVAIQCWGKRGPDMYLIDAVKQHLNFPDTMREIKAMRAKHPKTGLVLIEDKANGSAIIQMLQKEIPCVIGVNPDGGKVARVNAISGAIESGNVYLPHNADFTPDFVEECSAFPNGKHDDQVDCMSQALNRFIYYSATVPVTEKENEFPFHIDKPKPPLGQGGTYNVI